MCREEEWTKQELARFDQEHEFYRAALVCMQQLDLVLQKNVQRRFVFFLCGFSLLTAAASISVCCKCCAAVLKGLTWLIPAITFVAFYDSLKLALDGCSEGISAMFYMVFCCLCLELSPVYGLLCSFAASKGSFVGLRIFALPAHLFHCKLCGAIDQITLSIPISLLLKLIASFHRPPMSRRQRRQPDHHIVYYAYPTGVFDDDFSPVTGESLVGVPSSSNIQDAHQSIFECDAHSDSDISDLSAIASSSFVPSLQSEMNQTGNASMIGPSSSKIFSLPASSNQARARFC
ncbi:hypothetical protein SADUNF_Sadunf09G0061300 [Salix dunnii]|uniref:Transmembrane protein n=1 Tax=Salix dunnii TaxID=1413687 RepID=A0A835JXU7_9ROSI|nr:hypothetical protein SADUNF_Sadunf09G0061300 [Salix dunnii]